MILYKKAQRGGLASIRLPENTTEMNYATPDTLLGVPNPRAAQLDSLNMEYGKQLPFVTGGNMTPEETKKYDSHYENQDRLRDFLKKYNVKSRIR